MSGGHATAPSLSLTRSLVLPLLWRLRHFATLLPCCAALLLNETRHDRCTILAGRSRACYSHAHTHTRLHQRRKFRDVTHTHKTRGSARARQHEKERERSLSPLARSVPLSPPAEVCSVVVVAAAAVPSMEAPAAEPTAMDERRKIELFARVTRPKPTEAHPKRSLPVPVGSTRHATRTQTRRKRANAFFTDRFFLCFRDNRAYTTIHRVPFVLNERVQCRKAQNTSRKS